MAHYHLYAAPDDETDKGWVWTKREGTLTRTIVLMKNKSTKRSVYCEYREMDHNFVKRYNDAHEKYDEKYSLPTNPQKWEEILVINGWYRDALGRVKQQSDVDLELVEPAIAIWAALRAACEHPDPGVRVATRLAVIGTWLGVVGILFALLASLGLSVRGGVGISGVLLLLAFFICRGANRRA